MVAVGVDGCKKGWFYFCIAEENASFGVIASLEELLIHLTNDAVVAIDIPIGLREAGNKERLCDLEARKVLSPNRVSSVFPAPSRQAVYASSYEEASVLNREILGKGLTKQTWAIVPKIREVDELLLKSGRAKGMVREVHPEVCFWGLSGAPMKYSKKTREGFRERMRVLRRVASDSEALISAAFLEHGGFDAARDDIVDAFVAAVCARDISFAKTLPDFPEIDNKGLAMEIVYLDHRSN